MNFSTDRDLLAFEPTLFVDVAIASQERVSTADAAVTGTTLTSASADFALAQVEPGAVVLVNQIAHEVLARSDAHTLTISLPRVRLSEAAIPGPPSAQGSALPLIVRTFAPQAALVHDALLRLLGIDTDAGAEAALTEDAIVSLSAMARLEVLGTLERLYASAASLLADRPELHPKAQEYRQRFGEAFHQATILIDADGDGVADQRRDLGVMRLSRV